MSATASQDAWSAGPGGAAASALNKADPCAMVLFGATGDLAHRLVVPALYNLMREGALPAGFALIGVARHESQVSAWREALYKGVKAMIRQGTDAFNPDHLDEAAWNALSERMAFVQGDLSEPALYEALREALQTAQEKHQTEGNVLFYLAVEDHLFATVVDRLSEANLIHEPPDEPVGVGGWRRVVFEKPFGHDLASAQRLNADLAKHLAESQIFRIDHFLGKDMVQNILAFRFANGLFESIWNRDRIDHVQITALETLGVEGRGDFYEHTGALRDMAPNHLLSLMSLVAMEPPIRRDPESVRARKADLLAAISPADPARAVRGQYSAGGLDQAAVKAYRSEPNVSPTSSIETYAALELQIDTWRWEGVPFFIRTGKRLAARVTEIAIRFKPAPALVLQETPPRPPQPNWLIIRIAPDESISLHFEIKRRGRGMTLSPAVMTFNYANLSPREAHVGYEDLLYDAMVGDQILFMRADMVEEGWRIIQPVLDAWADEAPDFPNYSAGSPGPPAADRLIARVDDEVWRTFQSPEKPAPVDQ